MRKITLLIACLPLLTFPGVSLYGFQDSFGTQSLNERFQFSSPDWLNLQTGLMIVLAVLILVWSYFFLSSYWLIQKDSKKKSTYRSAPSDAVPTEVRLRTFRPKLSGPDLKAARHQHGLDQNKPNERHADKELRGK